MASISARASRSATPAADTRSATVAPSNAAGGIPRVSPITVKPRLLVAAAPPAQEAPLAVLAPLAPVPLTAHSFHRGVPPRVCCRRPSRRRSVSGGRGPRQPAVRCLSPRDETVDFVAYECRFSGRFTEQGVADVHLAPRVTDHEGAVHHVEVPLMEAAVTFGHALVASVPQNDVAARPHHPDHVADDTHRVVGVVEGVVGVRYVESSPIEPLEQPLALTADGANGRRAAVLSEELIGVVGERVDGEASQPVART